jgi:sugar O-acyltransferase (sialic acid O-acetyltransferase NeuD family)
VGSMMKKIAIYGSDGFAREILPIIRQTQATDSDIVFVDDAAELWGLAKNKTKIIRFEQAVDEGRIFVLAIANADIRKKLAGKVTQAGANFLSVMAPNVAIYDDVKIGEGAILCANVILTSNIQIGQQFHANIYSYVAHDCIIGDFVTFGPRVSCNGRVHIGDGAYIGTNAVIKQGGHAKPLTIGAGAVVGMGAVVTRDVAPGETVIGNPARVMEKKT